MASPGKPRGHLFRKYVVLFATLVTGALVTSGLIEIYFSYEENKAALTDLQREKALGAAAKIEQFVKEIERQLGWTTQAPLALGGAALEQRRFDFLRLLRQVPAVTEISYLDAAGKEQLRVSRLAMDVLGSQADRSREPTFTEAKAGRTYVSPVYFRKESEPYMTIAMAGASGGAGVVVADVNLKFIWDVVSQIKIGRAGRAYVVDSGGQLIAHPDISLVLQKTDLSALPQVAAARAGPPGPGGRREAMIAAGLEGRQVLTAHAPVPALRWLVFVEQPLEEAFESVRASAVRTAVLVLLGIALSVLASLVLARRMVTPIQALRAGAERIGAGDLGHRIQVRTGDELEALGDQFNRSAAQLQESYATLERRVEERTRELSEALEQQTATAEVLRIISSSPTDIQPVMASVAENAARLCDARDAHILLVEDGFLRLSASHGPRQIGVVSPSERLPIRRDAPIGRAIIDRETVHVHDLAAELDGEYPGARIYQERFGTRTILVTPLLREGTPIGEILVRRLDVRPFSAKQVALLQTFADQAVIAIENVRLFQELESRNREVTEALERQTATAEVLRVISSSPNDLTPVFEAILASASRLCEAPLGILFLHHDEAFEAVALRGTSPAFTEYLRGTPARRPGAKTGLGRLLRERRPVHIPDVTAEDAYAEGDPMRVATVELGGVRTFLAVPMQKEGAVIGAIVIYRQEVRPFGDKQIELVTTFANQAVIAIENVRLFQEVQARTRELTRSVEELRALGEVGQAVSSTLDLETVLATIVSRAAELSGSYGGTIYEFDEATQTFRVRATHRIAPEHLEVLRAAPIRLGEGAVGRAGATGEPVQVADILDEQEGVARQTRQILARLGFRSLLALPLLREQRLLGGLVVWRREHGQFSAEVVSLLQTFAAQSVLAIQNARLFQEIEEKSRQLEVANRHKSEFLANMSHELRTPLNAVIGFSEVLLERMFGDVNPKQEEYLQDILSSGRHLLSLINDILDLSKIEAGRMELEQARFHLPTALENALTLVRERATRRGISLECSVDDRIGDFVGDERKVKQIVLNLLSNAVKFTPEGGQVQVRAVIADGSVEVSVSDTGIGIAPEDQEAIFEEFRQVGSDYSRKREGTGLGLTLTRKFVEMHGGRIWVKSEPGKGSTFTVSLPERPWPTS